MSFQIIGTGKKVPEFALSNEQLSTMVDTSDEWITSRTGIKNRYILQDETLSEIGGIAANRALEDAGIEAKDIDLIICSTIQGDYITPSLACMIQKEIGATCPAFDVNAACTGFIYALDIAASYFARGTVKKVLIVAAEAISRYADYQDRATCVLFGDAAGAVVLSSGDNLLSIKLTADGNNEFLTIGGHKGNFPLRDISNHNPYMYMNGQEVYKFAIGSICRDVTEVMEQAGIQNEDVKVILTHQANSRILEAAKSKLEIDGDKFVSIIDRYGNTSSASIPVMFDELKHDGKLVKGDIIVLSAFGGGLTTGAAVLRW
ncbi:MAG: ketoacyl-ACP synthase [Bacillales bacterium]|jgi:3-oxoacyl-[acyl-carrier-protein] synthase-3|nr:ketoacyl-ACP synthase [Bacillales bacterium]